ncbi:hypothetical protein JCGZ_11925 [Jatropha curcas]|uniref:non-specific serine/threonine protein kinase n=1 Tax=Jatropha curcas TaxID=180498 RepID=A0A067KRJ2_JATCU|nr:hypothetical protein JCGZ_11925 [Jatropha curcas]
MSLVFNHFLLLCLSSLSAVFALNSDGSTLLSLLRHWTHVPSSIHSTWDSSHSTPCSWSGIQCHPTSFTILTVNLSGYGIYGQLGPEIGNLSTLQTLDLSNNNFSGQTPFQLASCSLLEYLDLSTNGFTGQVPNNFNYLQHLRFLGFYSNSLSGKVPESLFLISSLESVYLNNNSFTGSIPTSVGNLTHVQELWLNGNKLSGTVPETIGNCSKLQRLYLGENQLVGSLPKTLTNLKSLVYLFLAHNSFQGSIPLGFGNCKNLSVLDLSYNCFSGGLPSDLGNSTSLTILAIVHSNLTGSIPSSLGLLNKLVALDLSENRLSGKIPHELANCKSLTSLKLYKNQLEGAIPAELGKLTQLKDLELFTNNLSGEVPISIWRLQSLEYFLVYNNSLSGELPVEMTKLKLLKNISLYDNNFFGVIPQSLGINSSLLQLDFTNNKFTGEIPPNLCFGKQLRVLNLGHNQLQGSIPSDVGSCSSLWRLILKNNNISGTLPEFAENPSLSHIDISNNIISGSISPSLGNCSGLTSIDFSRNKLTGLVPPELGNLVKLEEVNLSYNQLFGSLPSQLSHCHKLYKFDVGINSLNGPIPPSLRNWTNLSTLILRENQFTGGIPHFLSELERLTELQIGGNLLGGEIPSSIGSLKGLQYALNLSSNGLTGAIPSELGDLIKLEQLDISNNNLAGTLNVLGDIHTLVLVNVSYNLFTGPIPDTLMAFLNSSPSSFVGNTGLCVNCAPSGSFTCAGNGNLRSCASRLSNKKGLTKVEIAMIGCGVASTFVLLGLACTFVLHRRHKQDAEIAAKERPDSLFSKVMEATENLNDRYIIGRGAHGTVYKASLGKDKVFAAKKIAFSNNGGNKSMVREIQTIGKIRHRNLIRLEEFWLRKDYGLILYRQMENGSLHDILHGKNAPSTLEWNVRFRIAIGTAHALAYLHYDCDPPLDFTNNKFTGEIPPNLCFGKQLRVLNLGHNQLQGSIPSDVGSCSSLWRLILKNNNISGTLPEFAENPTLSHMDISNNIISGPISPSQGNCSGLTSIDFSRNKLTGLIPPELGNLVKLEEVNLSYNQLFGSLPSQLSHCHKLYKFDVGVNSLNGPIPSSLRNWTNLSTLILRENQFTGGIPHFLSELERLTELQIGGNLLGGEIPSSIGSLKGLQYALNLSSNGLTGAIPSELGDLIKLEQLDISNNNLAGTLNVLGDIHTLVLVNVSYNLFTGPIPDTLMAFLNSSPSSFVGNTGLCVNCAPSGSFTCAGNGNLRSCASRLSNKKGLTKVEIAMIGCGVASAFVLLGLACTFVLHRRHKQDAEIAAKERPDSLFSKVMEATENLNDRYIIGRGAHGTVYKASLGKDKVFAAKKIAFSNNGGNKSMVREIQTIGKIRHRNLIRLEEFWLRKDYGLILYRQMENGSLHDILHGKNAPSTLEWNVRFRIAIGTAHALAYLHYDCDPPVLHRDVKPENILFDSDMETHISDFGIAKLLDQSPASAPSSLVIGTPGYIAPEHAFIETKSKESDVYSYGIVLLELITRKKALDPSFGEQTDIVEWSRCVWRDTEDIRRIADSGLAEEFYDSDIVEQVTDVYLLALRCTEIEPRRRPSMRDVVKKLQEANAQNGSLHICSIQDAEMCI